MTQTFSESADDTVNRPADDGCLGGLCRRSKSVRENLQTLFENRQSTNNYRADDDNDESPSESRPDDQDDGNRCDDKQHRSNGRFATGNGDADDQRGSCADE